MRIDPVTLLWEDLSPEDVEEMFVVFEDLILKGDIPHPKPKWWTDWYEIAGFDDRQQLMVMSTVIPSRLGLSLTNYYRSNGSL